MAVSLDDRRARWVLAVLRLWPAADDRDPTHDGALALAEALRERGCRIALTAAPPAGGRRQVDPCYHVSLDSPALDLHGSGAGDSFGVALWRAAVVFARRAHDARTGALDAALRKRGDPEWG